MTSCPLARGGIEILKHRLEKKINIHIRKYILPRVILMSKVGHIFLREIVSRNLLPTFM